MPYPRSEPIDEKYMDFSRYDGHHTICQNLRDMYHIAEAVKMLIDKLPKDDNINESFEFLDEVKLRCRIGMTMAKKMHEKLKWYKRKEESKE